VHQVNLWIPLIAGLLIIAVNGFFVAVEYALLASSRVRLQQAATQGSHAARRVLTMLEDPDKAIAAVQLGITAAGILLGIVAEEPLLALLEPLLKPALGAFFGPIVATALAGLLALVLLSYFLMVFGELTPKMLVLRAPERVAQMFIYPMWLFSRLTAPFVWVVDASTGLMLRLFGVKDVDIGHGTVATIEELRLMLKQSAKGVIEEDAREMLERVFDFGERVVREVMVPRTEIIGVERHQKVRELMEIFKRHRHSRFPIYEKDLDHIVGVIAIKDLVALLVEDPELMDAPVGELPIVQEPLMAPESRHIDDLFEEMRSKGIGLAIVIDEYGGTAGLVTREELVEEIVGAMSDEWVHYPPFQRVSPSAVEVDALLRVDEVNELLDIDLPEDDAYETLAGLILYRLRRIPEVGETVDVGDFRLEVAALEGPKITRVHILRK
ncbi:MAG TPA: HlyC/CorC family transporter, partial [Caldilineae bacterium]|nr:HlyC/CorC family transporter [Caldilineae bacterium]